MVAHRMISRTLAVLCVLVAGSVLVCASAQAAITHKLQSQITEVPAGAGVSVPGPLSAVNATAIDSGNLYVAEFIEGLGGERLDEFNASSGAFVRQFALPSSLRAFYFFGLAAGHATGEEQVYAGAEDSQSNQFVAVLDGEGHLIGEPWSGSDTPSGSFSPFAIKGIAADNSASLGDWAAGDVYVSDGNSKVVNVFKPLPGGKEEYVTRIEGPETGVPFGEPSLVAVDQSNGDVVVVDENDVVDIFEPTVLEKYELVHKVTGTPAGPFQSIETSGKGLAVDSNGDIYVAQNFPAAVVYQFSATGEYLGQLRGTPASPFNDVQSLAVDPEAHRLYVGDRGHESGVVDIFEPNVVVPDVTTGPASNVKPESATVSGTVNPRNAGEATCQVAWGPTTEFGNTTPCVAPIPDGGSAVSVQVALTGLSPDTTYYYRLQASNTNGLNPGEPYQDEELHTVGPRVQEASVSDVSATAATLNGKIDPNDAATTYYFQYGTSTAYGAEIPIAPGALVGSGSGDVSVSQHVQGLLASTTYHYRVVAVSELPGGEIAEAESPDQTFVTQAVASFALPDHRAWEMVSPADKHGAQILAIGQYSGEGGIIQAGGEGNAMTYVTASPTEANPAGYANLMQVLATRDSSGWASHDLGIADGSTTGISVGKGEEYRFFSEDLSLAVIQPFGAFIPSLSAEASEQTAYLHDNFLNGSVERLCSTSCYRPLVTGEPGYANVPSGTVFAGKGDCPAALYCGPEFIGATPDLKHVVLESVAQLTDWSTGGHHALYEWSDGKLTPVSVLPSSGESAEEPEFGSTRNRRRAISDDGSRVVWAEGVNGHLYLRDLRHSQTVRIDTVQGGSGEGTEAPVFQIASSDGSKIFFTDEQRLTADSNAENTKSDLYECEIVEVGSELECKLSDLTPSATGKPADVVGLALGASEDGSTIYFVANGVLAAGAQQGNCRGTSTPSAFCNVYVSHDGVTRLVAIVSGADTPDWSVETKDLSVQPAAASSNGEWLAFMSQRDLTSYNTRDALSGSADEEVYLYNNAGAGHLMCASCNPTGARPLGESYRSSLLYGGDRIWQSTDSLAAAVPGWTPYELSAALYQSRYLSNNGRLYFNSHDPLVPQDVNGTWDVYQYEPAGVGDCRESSVTFNPRSGGCAGLISSGGSAEESGFLDASATGGRTADGREGGGNVFFLTAAKLAPQDYDSALDIYDARECTTASPCFAPQAEQPPPCTTGDSCKPAPSPQPEVFGSPASATFSGAGNVIPQAGSGLVVKRRSLTRAQRLARALRTCSKNKQRRRRAVCVRRAKARFASSQASKVNVKRKGGR
jgi:hypothetical protein